MKVCAGLQLLVAALMVLAAMALAFPAEVALAQDGPLAAVRSVVRGLLSGLLPCL